MTNSSGDVYEKNSPSIDHAHIESIEVGNNQHLRQGAQRRLTARHAIFIAWGGTVGTGLFVTTGKGLSRGGPAFLVGSNIIISLLVYSILTAIVEMATFLPIRGGSMSHYGTQFVSRSCGFMMSTLYIYSFAILIPFELDACAIIIDFWRLPVPSAAWITIFGVSLVILNALPVRWYGDAESVFTGVKICTIFGLLILAIVLLFGGGPGHDRLGFRYWKHPGATKTMILDGHVGRLVAAVATFVGSVLPFTFTPEMIVATAGEIQSPRRNVPKAARHFTWRLIVAFVGSVFGISIICPSDAEALTAGSDAGSSPWVVGIRMAGISGLDNVINSVILVAAWSTGNAFFYLGSRAIHTMALEGSAPAIFKRCTAKGVPIYAVGAISLVLPLGYLTISSSALDVLYWLLNLVNTGGYISWVCCGVTYLRFRRACEVQGISDSQLTQRSWMQPYSSYVTIIVFSILCFLNAFTVLFPGHWSLGDFIPGYIGLPVFVGIYDIHRFVHKSEPWVVPINEINLQISDEELSDVTLEDETVSGFSTWQRLSHMVRKRAWILAQWN
ncbi:hypothetical protein ARSEF1564_003471 [Beauveria bassiana]